MLNPAPFGTTLAFDFGKARIGVAQGDAELKISHPLTTVSDLENKKRFETIAQLIQEWQPKHLVVGLPTFMDGSAHEMTSLSRKFANRLHGRFHLPVYLVDERLSSAVAEGLLREANVFGRKQKTMLDQVAAQAILETFFESGFLEEVKHLSKENPIESTNLL